MKSRKRCKIAAKMFQHDDAKGNLESIGSVYNNIHNITLDVVSEVQKDLTTYDLTSLVFLLYDVPETALQRLTILHRVSKDVDCSGGMDLLYDWAVHSHLRTTWRHEFLEALVVCQLYGVVKKMGFNVESVKRHYSPDNVNPSNYINTTRKMLYRLCEDMNCDNLIKLKKALHSYDIDTTEYEACELVILDLLCRRFIFLGCKNVKNELIIECNLDKLIKIIENCYGLASIANTLKEVESKFNYQFKKPDFLHHSSPYMSYSNIKDDNLGVVRPENLQDTIGLITGLVDEKLFLENLKTDATKQHSDTYEIKEKERVGVCYILNQEIFHPTKESIENRVTCQPLENREGSTKDKYLIMKTMKELNFHVETDDNLTHREILPRIKNVIKETVRNDDSIFVLCILSHGIEGHIYGADSVPVSVKDIEQLLDSEDAMKLRHKPKVFIIQACQTNHNTEPLKLIADGPKEKTYYLPQSDFLIMWATAPEYEAYRLGNKGSIFIHVLCDTIKQNIDKKHFADICTVVTRRVSNFCAALKHAQIPIYKSTFRKSLFLRTPKL